MKQILYFVKKEFDVDFKRDGSIASIFAYLLSVLFSVSLLFKNKHTPVSYSSVFLIIFSFTSIISSYRNFIKENNDAGLWNYVMYSPYIYILGKTLYLIILNTLTGFLLLILFIVFNGNLIENIHLFVLNIIGLSVGLGALLSLMGNISSKTDGNFTLMSIMSFPLLLPLLILGAKLSIAAVQNIPFTMNTKYLISLFALDIIILLLTIILFPQIRT
ncbi:MAG: hypothetical protein D6799_03335, partial [Bacteroidetes bacterium]